MVRRVSTFLGGLLLAAAAAIGIICADVIFADEYEIAPSDVLDISVVGEESLTRGEILVRPDGKISFPLVGELEAGGRTTSQIRDVIEQKIREFIPQAVISVNVKMLGSLQFYVVGKVAKPGMYNVSIPLTVLQAIALAGGPVTFAKEDKISIVRSSGTGTTRLPFDYEDVKEGKHLEQNILLQRGDVIVVP